MRIFITRFSTAVGSLLLIIGLLIVSIEMFALNPNFFESEYKALDTAASIGLEQEDLETITHNLLDYTAGRRLSLDMQAVIGGEEQEVFGAREKEHMVDVRALYQGARTVRTASLIGAAALLILAFALGGKRALRILCRTFLWVSAGFVVVVAAIAIFAALDFARFWTSFHHLFFTNDLWLLDPRTDVLIMMVPEQFFSDLVMRIIIRFISMFAALNIAAGVLLRLQKKRENGHIGKSKEA